MLESKKQHANVKNKDSPQRQKTISSCSKGWTNMRNDQSVKPKHIRWDRKGCGDFVVGCRVTDEKARHLLAARGEMSHYFFCALPAAAGRV